MYRRDEINRISGFTSIGEIRIWYTIKTHVIKKDILKSKEIHENGPQLQKQETQHRP